MKKQIVIVDAINGDVLKCFRTKKNSYILGKKFYKKFGERLINIIFIGKYYNIKSDIYINKNITINISFK